MQLGLMYLNTRKALNGHMNKYWKNYVRITSKCICRISKIVFKIFVQRVEMKASKVVECISYLAASKL